jgi:XTP/dITP diphosphohydrolase
MFQPEGHAKTFGELSSEEKHGIDWTRDTAKALSHRARAFVKLAEGCLGARG